MNREFHIGIEARTVLAVLRGFAARLDVMFTEEARIHANGNNRHLHYIFIDEERTRRYLARKSARLERCATEGYAMVNRLRGIEFRRIFVRHRTIGRTAELDTFRECRRIQLNGIAIEPSLETAHICRRSRFVIRLYASIRLFRGRLFKVLPIAAIRNAPAIAGIQFRIINGIANSIISVDQVKRTAVLVEFPVRMRTRVAVTVICTYNSRNILLVAEDDLEALRLDDIVTKNKLARILAAFNKRIAAQVHILVACVVKFHPRRIVAVFI